MHAMRRLLYLYTKEPITGLPQITASEERTKEELAQLYLTEIEQNPFSLSKDDDVYELKAEEKRLKKDRLNFYKQIPISKRLDYAQRNAMLSLSEPAHPALHGSVAAPVEADAHIRRLALQKPPQLLQQKAPGYSQKYAMLPEEDQEFLAALPRQPPEQKLDQFLDKQKQIFLVELSLESKQQQIDMLDADVHRRELALESSQATYEKDVEQFDKQVRQSDQLTIEAAIEQEKATKDRRAKQEKIMQATNSVYQLQSEIARNELVLLKCLKYRDFIQQMQSIEERRETLERSEKYAALRQRIALACQQRGSCEGVQIGDEGAEGGMITYSSVENEEIREFLQNNRPIISSDHLKLREVADYGGLVLRNFPTQTPGVDDYTAVCIHEFVDEPIDLKFSNSNEFIDTMKLIESNNFYLVENLREAEQTTENDKLSKEMMLKNGEKQQKELELQIEKLKLLNEQTKTKIGLKTGLTDQELTKMQLNAEELEEVVKNGYEQVIDNITSFIRQNSNIEKVPFYSELVDVQSISALSMLSWLEGNLERINGNLCEVNERDKFLFERQRERSRRKAEEERIAAEKEVLRKEKIDKCQERSKEPIRLCDVRDVKFVSFAAEKRVIGKTEVVKEEDKEIDFYE